MESELAAVFCSVLLPRRRNYTVKALDYGGLARARVTFKPAYSSQEPQAPDGFKTIAFSIVSTFLPCEVPNYCYKPN